MNVDFWSHLFTFTPLLTHFGHTCYYISARESEAESELETWLPLPGLLLAVACLGSSGRPSVRETPPHPRAISFSASLCTLRKGLLVPKLDFFCISPFLFILSTVDMENRLLFLPSAASDIVAELSWLLFSPSLSGLLNWSSGISRLLDDEFTLNIFKDWKQILKTGNRF